MYKDIRLFEAERSGDLPMMLALATPTHFDVDAVINREDGLVYRPEIQRNEGGPLAMGSSTCHRRDSTGLIFTDNDRQQDD